jgi:hypothetical protein
MDNTLLRIAFVTGRLLLYLLYASLILITLGLAYVLFSGDMDVLSIVTFSDSGLVLSTDRGGQAEAAKPLALGLLVFYGSKAILVLGCYVFIIRECLKIISSLKSLDTFRGDNIKSFQRVGQWFVLLFLLSVVQISQPEGAWEITLAFDPSYLLGTLVCYLLAEIFREGNRLMEESKLTI